MLIVAGFLAIPVAITLVALKVGARRRTPLDQRRADEAQGQSAATTDDVFTAWTSSTPLE